MPRVHWLLAVLILALLLVLLFALSADAQQRQPLTCRPHAAMLAALAERGEEVVGVGVIRDGIAAMTITASPEGRWSLVITQPTRRACIVQVGMAWEPAPGMRL